MILNVVREHSVSVSVYSPIDIDLVKINPKALNTRVRDDLIYFLKQRITLGSKYYQPNSRRKADHQKDERTFV